VKTKSVQQVREVNGVVAEFFGVCRGLAPSLRLQTARPRIALRDQDSISTDEVRGQKHGGTQERGTETAGGPWVGVAQSV
jgi:hypothetical protein